MIENKYFSDNTSDYTIAEVKDLFDVIVSSKIPNVEHEKENTRRH